MTRLGYQIPNFTYPDIGPDRLFEVVARQAKEAFGHRLREIRLDAGLSSRELAGLKDGVEHYPDDRCRYRTVDVHVESRSGSDHFAQRGPVPG